jgi:hypothetical protein
VPNYRSIATVTVETRCAAYDALGELLSHLDPLGVELASIVYNATTQRLDIVTLDAIPEDQLEHLGIEGV